MKKPDRNGIIKTIDQVTTILDIIRDWISDPVDSQEISEPEKDDK